MRRWLLEMSVLPELRAGDVLRVLVETHGGGPRKSAVTRACNQANGKHTAKLSSDVAAYDVTRLGRGPMGLVMVRCGRGDAREPGAGGRRGVSSPLRPHRGLRVRVLAELRGPVALPEPPGAAPGTAPGQRRVERGAPGPLAGALAPDAHRRNLGPRPVPADGTIPGERLRRPDGARARGDSSSTRERGSRAHSRHLRCGGSTVPEGLGSTHRWNHHATSQPNHESEDWRGHPGRRRPRALARPQ